MDQVRHANVHDLLAVFLEMDVRGQIDFLANEGIDSKVRKEVGILASFKDEALDFLSLSAPRLSRDFFGPAEDLSGRRIGKFVLVGELGSGGMGTVYLAERWDEEFDQKVAIKILRRELDTQHLREAFSRELANQALLIHPNIAAIID